MVPRATNRTKHHQKICTAGRTCNTLLFMETTNNTKQTSFLLYNCGGQVGKLVGRPKSGKTWNIYNLTAARRVGFHFIDNFHNNTHLEHPSILECCSNSWSHPLLILLSSSGNNLPANNCDMKFWCNFVITCLANSKHWVESFANIMQYVSITGSFSLTCKERHIFLKIKICERFGWKTK